MAVSLALANEILQKDYLPGFVAQLNEEASFFYKLMEKDTNPALGADSTFLVTYGRSQGVGNRAEGDQVPQAGAVKRKQISVVPKNFYARLALSDRLIKSSKTGASFINALDQEMNELMRDSKNSLNRQMFGDGKGVMATLTAAITAAKDGKVDNIKYLAVNQKVDILDKTTPTTVKASGVIIENFDDETGDITFSTNVTAGLGDLIVTAGAYNQEITGLDAIMTKNNVIYGLDRNDNKWFNPSVTKVDAVLDEATMEAAMQRVDFKYGLPDIIIAGYGAYRSLKDYMSQFQRFVEIETKYKAGYKTLSYDGVPVERDKYQKDDVMDFLAMKHFKLLSIGDLFDYMALDGNILKAVPNYAQYEAILTSYAEIACDYPGANVRLTDIK